MNLCRECLRMFEIANADVFGEGAEPTLEEIKEYIENQARDRYRNGEQP